MIAMKARLCDVPALAWTSALAFTRQSGRDRPFRAALEYLIQLTATLGQQINGGLFHKERTVMVGIADQRESQLRSRLIASVVLVLPVLMVSLVVPLLTGSVLASIAGMLLLFGSMGPAIKRMMRSEAREAERVLKRSFAALPDDQPVYTYTQLARRLNASPGSAQQLLAAVLDQEVPQGALVSCIAADRGLIPIYEQFGLYPLEGSLAMLTPEPKRPHRA